MARSCVTGETRLERMKRMKGKIGEMEGKRKRAQCANARGIENLSRKMARVTDHAPAWAIAAPRDLPAWRAFDWAIQTQKSRAFWPGLFFLFSRINLAENPFHPLRAREG